jgi:hypothetical protein
VLRFDKLEAVGSFGRIRAGFQKMREFFYRAGAYFLLAFGLAAQTSVIPVGEPQKTVPSSTTGSHASPAKKSGPLAKKGAPAAKGATTNGGASKNTTSPSGTGASKNTAVRSGSVGPAVSSATQATVSKPPAAASNSKSAAAHKNATTKRPATVWRSRQLAPTPTRYKEIQQALAAKGYLKPEDATGKWDDSSVEALKKFQSEQNLDVTGKINALSLIALGLGPKHDTASSQSSPH